MWKDERHLEAQLLRSLEADHLKKEGGSNSSRLISTSLLMNRFSTCMKDLLLSRNRKLSSKEDRLLERMYRKQEEEDSLST